MEYVVLEHTYTSGNIVMKWSRLGMTTSNYYSLLLGFVTIENAKCRGTLYSVNELQVVRSFGRVVAGFPLRQLGANRAGLVVDRVAIWGGGPKVSGFPASSLSTTCSTLITIRCWYNRPTSGWHMKLAHSRPTSRMKRNLALLQAV